jgi:hypothetical protein
MTARHTMQIPVRLMCPCCHSQLTAKVSMELVAAAVAKPLQHLRSPSRRGEPSQLPFVGDGAGTIAPAAKRRRHSGGGLIGGRVGGGRVGGGGRAGGGGAAEQEEAEQEAEHGEEAEQEEAELEEEEEPIEATSALVASDSPTPRQPLLPDDDLQ